MKEVEVMTVDGTARIEVYPREELEARGEWPELTKPWDGDYQVAARILLPGEPFPGGMPNLPRFDEQRKDALNRLYTRDGFLIHTYWEWPKELPGWAFMTTCPFVPHEEEEEDE